MVELYAAFGEWKLNDKLQFEFLVDRNKGGSLCEVDENVTYKELVEMVVEDLGIDCLAKERDISLSYGLPMRMKVMVEDSTPIYVRNDRQVRTLIKKIKEDVEPIRLCVTVSDKCNDVAVEIIGSSIQSKTIHTQQICDVEKRHVLRVVDGDPYVAESNVHSKKQVNDKFSHIAHVGSSTQSKTIHNNEDCEVEKNQRTHVLHNLYGGSSVNISNVHENQQELHPSIGSEKSVYVTHNDDTSSTAEKGSYPYHLLPAPDPAPVPIGCSFSTRGADDIHVNRYFNNKDELMLKMRKWALEWKFEFKSHWSDTTRVMLRCVDDSCSWRMRATKVAASDSFVVKKYVHEHTCDTTHINANHRQATANVIGNLISSNYGEKKEGLKPKQIIELVRQEHGVQINYKKAWRAKEQGQCLISGSAEDSYYNLAKWLFMVKEKNPGSEAGYWFDEAGYFKYTFVAFGQSIRGFGLMRRVIAVDGTFLKAKFRGTLLAATAQDDASDLVFVSDRSPAIAKALSQVYPAAHHGICRFHLLNNLKTRFGKFLKLVEAAANAYTKQEFSMIFGIIRSKNQELAKYLEDAGFRKWARSYAPSNRYNMMTTNIAESLNSMLNMPRELPVISLLETIRLTLTTWFHERRVKAAKHNKRVTPNVVKELVARFDDAMKLDVYQVNEYEFEVKDETRKYIVHLKNKQCTCYVFDIDKIPCVHAIVAAKRTKRDENKLVDDFYLTDTWAKAYAESIHPCADVKSWDFPEAITRFLCGPPSTRQSSGRPPKKRKRSVGEFGVPGSKFQRHKCSRCGREGHNKSTCRTPI